MYFEKSKSGMGVIRINTDDTYMSFGSSDPVKYISIRIPDDGRLFPVALKRIPAPYTKAIGKKNIKIIRELITERLVDGALSQKQVMEIGDIINCASPKEKSK
jgi:hypothetical protein